MIPSIQPLNPAALTSQILNTLYKNLSYCESQDVTNKFKVHFQVSKWSTEEYKAVWGESHWGGNLFQKVMISEGVSEEVAIGYWPDQREFFPYIKGQEHSRRRGQWGGEYFWGTWASLVWNNKTSERALDLWGRTCREGYPQLLLTSFMIQGILLLLEIILPPWK